MPSFGWIFFARPLALKSFFLYGGELAHHFHLDHPWFSLGAYAMVEGSLTEVIEPTRDSARDVDVIIASGGTTFGIRGLGRLLPVLRAGAGFILADGTPGGLDVVGRMQFHIGGGLRYYLFDWIVIRAELRAIIHENLQFGAGSGQLRDVVHWVVSGGIGVAR